MALDQRGQGSTPAAGVTAPTRARMQRCPTRSVHPSPARGGAILPHQGHKGQRPCRRSRIRRGVHSFRQPAAGGHRGTAGGSWRWAHGQRGVRRGCRPRRALAGCGWMAPRRLQDRTTGGDHRQSDRGTTPPRRPPALAHLHLRPFSGIVTRTLGACSRPCAAMRRGAHAALIRALTTGDIPPQGLQVAWVIRPVVAPCRFTHATRRRTPVRRAVGGSI